MTDLTGAELCVLMLLAYIFSPAIGRAIDAIDAQQRRSACRIREKEVAHDD